MLNSKPAPLSYSVHPLIQNRWSSMAISSQSVDPALVASLLEAARWAASSYNEQPWSYVVGYLGDENHSKLASCLVEGNSWARLAPVLMMSVADYYFSHNHKPNRHYMHDVGAANATMHLQATELGLSFHQMAGFENEKAEELFGIGDEHEAVSIIAIGYPGEASHLPENLREREVALRSRKSFEEMFWSPEEED